MQAPTQAPPQRSRGNLVFPLILIAIGVIALLINAGALPWGSILRMADLWPLILVVIGVELVARSTLPAAAVHPAAVAVLGLALIVAIVYAAIKPPVVFNGRGTASASTSAPIGDLKAASLELGLGAARVNVHSGDLGHDLYHLSYAYPGAQAPDVSLDTSAGRLSIQDHQTDWWMFWAPGSNGPRSLDLTLNTVLPWAISIGGGATRTVLDLSGVDLKSVDFSGGANNIELSLPSPKGTIDVAVSGGATSITVHRPPGVPVSLHVAGGASSAELDGSRFGFVGGDQTWRTPGYASAQDRYSIDVSGGANHVTVDTSPAATA